MTKKVFIVTGSEIASYTSAQQENLLSSMEKLGQEYPTASVEDIINYARQYLVLIPSENPTTIVEEVVNPEIAPVEEIHFEDVENADNLNEQAEQLDETVEVSEVEEELTETYETEEPQSYDSYVVEPEAEQEVEVEAVPEELAPEEVVIDGDSAYTGEYKQTTTLYEREEPVEEPVEEEENETISTPDDAQVAFRNTRFQGVFREASKLDN